MNKLNNILKCRYMSYHDCSHFQLTFHKLFIDHFIHFMQLIDNNSTQALIFYHQCMPVKAFMYSWQPMKYFTIN